MTQIWIWAIVIIAAIGLVLSIATSGMQKRERDSSTNEATAKHPFWANPIVIAYVLFPIIIVIGGIIALYYF